MLLSEFYNLITPIFHTITPKHGTEHFILTTGPLIHSHFCYLKPDKLQIAKDEFDKMKSLSIICHSSSPWSLPLYMVPKNSGGWQLCGDCCCLNNTNIPD